MTCFYCKWSWTVGQHRSVSTKADVRFGSKADMCSAKGHVRFGPITTGSAPTAEAKKAPAGASLAQW
jgi:hypothetical protein